MSPESVAQREAAIGKGGVMPGKELGLVFSSLRANDLVWPYVVSRYLKGKGSPAFDMLFWNSDATNLPGPMFCWYVRNTYLENRLREPGKTGEYGWTEKAGFSHYVAKRRAKDAEHRRDHTRDDHRDAPPQRDDVAHPGDPDEPVDPDLDQHAAQLDGERAITKRP